MNLEKQLNNIIVLADNKNYNRKFLQIIGMSSGHPYLCSIHIPTKLYTFQQYGLEETDEKIYNHVLSNAGLIIICHINNYSNLFDRISSYTNSIDSIPILIVIEYTDSNNLNINMINKPNVRYELFSIATTIINANLYNFKQSGKGIDNLNWFNNIVVNYKPNSINNNQIISLEKLIEKFIDCSLTINEWNHFNRLRIVYFSLVNFGYADSINQSGWLYSNWIKYKNTIGHNHLWNYTLTKFWIDILYKIMLKEPNLIFSQIYSKYTYLSNGNLHKQFYSNEILFSNEARNKWIEPNLI